MTQDPRIEPEPGEPDWDTPISLTTTPALLIHALMATASAVHTGWSSCVDDSLLLSDLVAMDDQTGNYARLAEQEFVEDGKPETVWHDWTLELRFGPVLTTGHWQVEVASHAAEWEWNAAEARRAFERACVLIGRRVRPALAVDDPMPSEPVPRTSRH
jgi:hypothetical protein